MARLTPVLALFVPFAVASAEEEVHTVDIALTTTNWQQPVPIPQFDPTNRILEKVTLLLESGFIADIQFENQDQNPQVITVDLTSGVAINRPDTTQVVLAQKVFSVTQNLAGFDGTVDFMGPSGHSSMGLTDSDQDQYDSAMPPDAADTALFVGQGTINFEARAGGTHMSTGPSNLVTLVGNKASAKVTVTYTFSTDCNKNNIPDDVEIKNDPSLDQASGTGPTCEPNGILDECEKLEDCQPNGVPDVCDVANGTSDDAFDANLQDCGSDGIPDECQEWADCQGDGIPDVCQIVDLEGTDPSSNDCNDNGIPDECEPDCDDDGIPDDCDDECVTELDCEEFDRTETLTPNDTLTVFTKGHNPEQAQGFVYAYAVDAQGDAISFDHIIGNQLVFNGIASFSYSINPIDFRAGPGVAHGAETDDDGDGILDLDGVEYESFPGEILVPRFLGYVENAVESEMILLALSGGARFTTTTDFLIYNDNESQFSAQYTFRCWDKVRLTEVSTAFTNQFLDLFSGDDPTESLGSMEYGWYRVFGDVAISNFFDIMKPAVYAVHLANLRGGEAADLPFETCTRSAHLFPRTATGDNTDQGPPDLDCSGDPVARNLLASLLIFAEFDNRHGMTTVLTVTNTNRLEQVRVHFVYIGRYGNL